MERESREGNMKKIGVSIIVVYMMGVLLAAKSFARLRMKRNRGDG